ncbi:LURP-one-related family protein [Deinococcus hopiensis]|uniref:Uncharacterized protein n=1 Tax=Deinococcus hopiensis KR-140 TaxID=695939 RepID=A0A1W1UKX6_9DEIO|nr:LURP-one-related family protein [Deinococcus hopiensis]SMB81673.1 hypothetical protein SAMN00790413_04672 [Deinococcus hopiensis KR-140]
MAHHFPLKAAFRIVTLSPEVQVLDAHDQVLLQVKQKMLTLREDTTVFADAEKTRPLYRMKADRMSGFRAVHAVTRLADGQALGSVRAAGLRFLWRARYDVTDPAGNTLAHVQEQNPWTKVVDALLDEVPLIGPLVAMFINPRYTVQDAQGRVFAMILKKRSFVARHFTLERLEANPPELSDELLALGLVQVIFLERGRQ